jgi:DNA-binding transcriptional LysR family regulator
MELRHLRYFLAVAEDLHVGRAAQRLHISQPPLSRQIHQLEEELGVALFKRDKKRLHLTAAGSAFLEESRAILDRTDRAVRMAQRAARGEVGLLRIGFIESATASGLLGTALTRFRTTYPDVEVELGELTSLRQADALRAHQLDVGFIYTRPPETADLVLRRVLPGCVVTAVARSNPLAKYRHIPLTTVAQQPLIIWRRALSPVLYDQIMSQCRAAGHEPHVVQHTSQMQTTISLAAAGVGLGIVPSSFAATRIPGVVYRTIAGLGIRMDMELMFRVGDQSPVLHAFITVVEDVRPDAVSV